MLLVALASWINQRQLEVMDFSKEENRVLHKKHEAKLEVRVLPTSVGGSVAAATETVVVKLPEVRRTADSGLSVQIRPTHARARVQVETIPIG